MANSELTAFKQSVLEGLSKPIKTLSSQYFYDDAGSKLFQQIMNLPEYYLTNAEFDILQNQSGEILQELEFTVPFNIVELGAGDGKKTIELLRYLSNKSVPFTYVPIDISSGAIDSLEKNVFSAIPNISIQSMVGDYFDMLESLKKEGKPILLLFLGSNIGNFNPEDASELICRLANIMQSNDALLLGADLQKNPHTIRKAYDDDAGVTRAFNLNLLKRINRELGANFDLEQWDFYSNYNPINGEVRSFIISLSEQIVQINSLNTSFHFGKNELIYTELSKKFTPAELQSLGKKCGLKTKKMFFDSNKYFTDTLYMK